MNINKKSLHFKLYNFWHKLRYGWELDSKHDEHINLCPYVRTVVFYWWLRLLFLTKAAWVTVPILLFEIPRLVGILSYNAKVVVYILYIGLAIVAAGIGTLIGGEKFFKDTDIGSTINQVVATKTVSFVELISAWVKSIHDGICPVLTIKGEQ